MLFTFIQIFKNTLVAVQRAHLYIYTYTYIYIYI